MKTFLLFLLVLISSASYGRYLSIYSGFHISQHQYLTDNASLTTPFVGAKIDSTHLRRKSKGWFSRGIAAQFTQGTGYQAFRGQIPFFNWAKNHGVWFDYSYSKQNLEADISEAAIFLGDDGNTTAISAGSNVSAEHQMSRMAVYWYESIKHVGPLNYLGLYQSNEITPAATTLTGTNASLFDGSFSGYGIVLGRKKDQRGLNFQWNLQLAKLNSSFSNDVTGHRSVSAEESTVYQLDLELSWHYRFYLAPYWYLVPEIKIQTITSLQTTMDPQQVDHDPFVFIQSQSLLSLQKRF